MGVVATHAQACRAAASTRRRALVKVSAAAGAGAAPGGRGEAARDGTAAEEGASASNKREHAAAVAAAARAAASRAADAIESAAEALQSSADEKEKGRKADEEEDDDELEGTPKRQRRQRTRAAVVAVIAFLAACLRNIGAFIRATITSPGAMLDKVQAWRDRPNVRRLWLSLNLANTTLRLPALLAVIGTQISVFASSASLPMLAPLLVGGGFVLRTIAENAGAVFLRLGISVTIIWGAYAVNCVANGTVQSLQDQGTLEARFATVLKTSIELCAGVFALVALLSAYGVQVSGLLLPTAAVMAFAAKDVIANLFCGFFLFMVQPLKVGDTVAVRAGRGEWFEGTCIGIDLRYVALRDGRRRLLVPNRQFVSNEFIVMEPGTVNGDSVAVLPPAPDAKPKTSKPR